MSDERKKRAVWPWVVTALAVLLMAYPWTEAPVYVYIEAVDHHGRGDWMLPVGIINFGG